MLYLVAAVLFTLWLFGFLRNYTLGGTLHLLLIVALIILVANFIQSRVR